MLVSLVDMKSSDLILRMEQLKNLRGSGHGQYNEIMDEKQVLHATVWVCHV